MSKEVSLNQEEYGESLKIAVSEIRVSRNTLVRQVTSSTNSVYWNLGKLLSKKKLKRFFERYHLASEILRQAVAVLPWGITNCKLIKYS
jgi:glutamine amidotransferase PdxT